MQFTIYPSDKGDCNLVTAKSGHRILADGGMGVSYKASVAAQLTKFIAGKKNKTIDVVYVSHIDDDHIGGVLAMLDDLMAWRVFDHQKKIGNPAAKPPARPRPPDIGQIWHNGFGDLLTENAGAIESQLAESAAVLSGFTASDHRDDHLRRAVQAHQNLAESVPQAIRLSRRIADGQLGIALNKPASGRLMMRRTNAAPITLGSLAITILAPASADLKRLRDDWNKWLRTSKSTLATINAKARSDAGSLTNAAVGDFIRPLITEAVVAAETLSNALKKELSPQTLGNRTAITSPNLASLMLMVQEKGKTILLTGDGYADDVTAGLESAKLLDADGRAHVNVLKVPHHGATNNMTDDFASRITADHYVFCGNGFATNPEREVIERLAEARLGPAAPPAQAKKHFTFWFNSSAAAVTNVDQQKHMETVESDVAALVKKSKGRLTARFMGPGDAAHVIAL